MGSYGLLELERGEKFYTRISGGDSMADQEKRFIYMEKRRARRYIHYDSIRRTVYPVGNL